MIEWLVRKMMSRKQMPADPDIVTTAKILNTLDKFGTQFQYYEAIIQSCKDCIARSTLDGHIVFANHAYAKVFCGDPDVTECHGIYFLDQVHPDDLEMVKQRMVEIQEPPYGIIVDQRALDYKGDTRYFNWHVTGILDDEGKVYEFLCVGREYTDFVRWDKATHDLESYCK